MIAPQIFQLNKKWKSEADLEKKSVIWKAICKILVKFGDRK